MCMCVMFGRVFLSPETSSKIWVPGDSKSVYHAFASSSTRVLVNVKTSLRAQLDGKFIAMNSIYQATALNIPCFNNLVE